jgi:hypothetical protein
MLRMPKMIKLWTYRRFTGAGPKSLRHHGSSGLSVPKIRDCEVRHRTLQSRCCDVSQCFKNQAQAQADHDQCTQLDIHPSKVPKLEKDPTRLRRSWRGTPRINSGRTDLED